MRTLISLHATSVTIGLRRLMIGDAVRMVADSSVRDENLLSDLNIPDGGTGRM